MRCRAERVAIAALVLSGCAFSDGDPFGVADVQLSAVFDPPPARLQDGALKTPDDYLVSIHRLAIVVHAFELERATAAAASFDPANPPAGYSLCHNGHCHSADGRLVDYEDIVAEGGGSVEALHIEAPETPVDLSAEPAAIALECPEPCVLGRGDLSRAIADAGELVVMATVDHPSRLPAPLEVDATLEIEVAVDAPLEVAIDDGEPLGVRIRAVLRVPPHLFDGVDFSTTGTSAEALAPLIRNNLGEHAELGLDVERFD